MQHGSSSLRGYHVGRISDQTDPNPDDQRFQIAGWGPAVFLAAMVVIMMISAVLVTAISHR